MSATLAERVAALRPRIEACRDSIDHERRLPDDLLAALHHAGLFRVLLPAHLGGEQPRFTEWLAAVEQLAQMDASTGWCVNQGGVFATVAAWLRDEVARELWRAPDAVIAHGPPREARGKAVGKDYQLSGRWAYGSGIRHATLACGLAPVDGEGPPRLFILPRAAVQLIDTWQVSGLRGTGSFDFAADAQPVPRAHTVVWATDRALDPWPGYRIGMLLLFACSFGAVALGAARSALNGAIELTRSRHAQNTTQAARQDVHVHDQLGHAEIRWRAARALLHTSVDAVWDELQHQRHILIRQRVDLRMAGTHAMREARAVADIAANVSGADVIRADHPVNRPWQDVLAAAQHMQARTANYALLGHHLLDPQNRQLGPMV